MKRLSLCLVISLWMTATLVGCGGGSSSTALLTPAQVVAADKSALALGYALGDSCSSVTQDLTLIDSSSQGSTITWNSSNPAVISNAGVVTRPLTGDSTVTLTATITMTPASDTRLFPVTVKAQMTDADAVAAAKAALVIGYATGDSADTKQFPLTVKVALSDPEAMAADKAALTIGYGPGDSAASLQHNLVLPTSGTNGSDISWASSNAAVISSSGGVTVPSDSDAHVTMTATIHKGAASDTAPFDLTVKALLLSSWVNVNLISPGNGAIEVDPGIVVRIPFARALDASTVSGAFQLYQTTNSQPVAITVAYDGPSRTVSLTPESPLVQGTRTPRLCSLP